MERKRVLYRFGLAFVVILLLVTSASATAGNTPVVNSTSIEAQGAPADTLTAADESLLEVGSYSDSGGGECYPGH